MGQKNQKKGSSRSKIKIDSKHTKTKSLLHIHDLVVYPFPCCNCGKLLNSNRLFCSNLCRDEAKFVRYFRACIADGRFEQQDVKEAIRIRLAHLLRGGYRERLRQVSKEIREAVIHRDKGLCRNCGVKGLQIDHINGDNNDIENLQLLCAKCHLQKTREKIILISPKSHPIAWEKRKRLLSRVHSPNPMYLCDNPDWAQQWKVVKKRRSELLKSSKLELD